MRKAALLLVCVLAMPAMAERPPEFRKDADTVFTGVVQKVEADEKPFGGDGVRTEYTARVKVTKSEKGASVVGETISVKWFHVTKAPTKPLPGAYGQKHEIKAKDEATFWAMQARGFCTVIYNKDGIEKLK